MHTNLTGQSSRYGNNLDIDTSDIEPCLVNIAMAEAGCEKNGTVDSQ